MPDNLEEKKRIFFPNLDGLRFFCFLGVFLCHSFATPYTDIQQTGTYRFVKGFLVAGGSLGVNFFFVLSGFLITYLLIAEKSAFQRINIGAFYTRRILRIWPLFYSCIIFGFFIFPRLKLMLGQTPNETATLWHYLTFTNNFDVIRHGLADSSTLNTLWSVAVEEQFYLFWPLLLFILPMRKYPLAFLPIIIGSFIFRMVHFNADPIINELNTFSVISDMAIGACAAWLAFFSPRAIAIVRDAPRWIWILLYMAVATVLLFQYRIFGFPNPFIFASGRLVISLLFALVILEQNYAVNSLFKMSRFRTLSRLGTYTYGMYCLHMIGILVAQQVLKSLHLNRNVWQVIFLEGSLSLLLSIGLAIVSYRLLERPFLKLKKHFARIVKD